MIRKRKIKHQVTMGNIHRERSKKLKYSMLYQPSQEREQQNRYKTWRSWKKEGRDRLRQDGKDDEGDYYYDDDDTFTNPIKGRG